jgi:hypothetical protein
VRRGNVGLGPFLEALEQRLDALSAEQLRAILVGHATRLSADERAGFLAVFDQPPQTDDGLPGGSDGAGDVTLVADVDGFVADIAAGVYVDGWGYDPGYRDHRAFGDETWTFEFDHLLDRAGLALLAGDATTAREAYRRLFAAIEGEYDEGGFPGAGTPPELASTDMGEAKHRYLRAVWESEPTATRAAALLAAMEDTAYLGDTPTLAALEATRREPLADLDRVLPVLIAHLGAVPAGCGFGTQARRLLAEATERHGGIDALAGLAHTPGDQQLAAYRDWIDALVRARRLDDTRQAATEALDQLDLDGPVAAAIAERQALLTADGGDDTGLLAARQTAWRADPTLDRLVTLVDVATALDQLDPVLSEEADHAGSEPLSRRRDLAAGLLLLAGRVDDAIRLVEATDDGGWDSGHHPVPVVVPFLLTSASDAARHEEWGDSLLLELLDRANNTGWRYDRLRPDDGLEALRATLTDDGPPAAIGRFRAIPPDDLLLSTLLTDSLERHPPPASARQRWLSTGRRLVDVRVDEVVGGQHRAAYAQVAHLAAACAEAIALATGPDEAGAYLDDLHARYPRHNLFRRELRTVAEQSPLLG